MTTTHSSGRYALRAESRGDQFYVHVEIGLDHQIRISLRVDPDESTFTSREVAERWAAKVARRDPSLTVTVVAV